MKKPVLVTTSIAYVNSVPHLGFTMELIQADVIARWHKKKGHEVFFLTGTDEHGLKISQRAKQKNCNPQDWCNQISTKYRDLSKKLNISNNDFIRTTEKRHISGAKKFWEKIVKNLEMRKFSGNYCIGCENFLTEKDLIEGKCSIHFSKPEKISEENYFFKLSNFSKKILGIIKNNEIEILPSFRKNEILQLLKTGLHDVSFSRPTKKLDWGITVPNDQDQKMYVWCDALTNYISALGFTEKSEKFKKFWEKAEVWHFIGKDILRFHAGIWPGMLLAAGLKLPNKICVHGFLTNEGQKMSKTLGNVVDPFKILEIFSNDPDPLRYFLIAEIPFGRDADFSVNRLLEIYHSHLANGIGNLVSRVTKLAKKVNAKVTKKITEKYLIDKVSNLSEKIDTKMKNCEISLAISEIWNLINFLNVDIENKKPWKEIKQNPDATKKNLENWITAIEKISENLEIFLPDLSQKIKNKIDNFSEEILFPRIIK